IVVTTSLDLLGPILIGKAADAVVASPAQVELLVRICLGFFAIILLKALSEMAQAFTIQTTGLLITQQLRVRVFDRIARFPMAYFDEHSSGRLITRVINDVKSISELFTASMSVLALDVMVILGTMGAMLILDWKLAGLILLTFPAVVWAILYFGEKLADAYREARSKLSQINSFLAENISAMPTIHRLGAHEARRASFDGIVEQHQVALMKSIEAYAQVQPWANMLNGVAMATLLGVGGFWVIQGKVKVGILVAFLAYIRNLFQPIRDLVEKYNVVLSALVSAERVVSVFDEPIEEDRVFKTPEIARPCGVSFRDVSFKYRSREEMALQQINFELPPGKTLAIVGATGSGKSTIARLLLRFYEPAQGEICLGGAPLAQWPLGTLRQHVGFIPQDVYLFEGTVRDNLALANKVLTDAFLIEQCKKAQVWDFIGKRGGLDLVISEGGNNLSLGEKQLLSFARMLVLNPEVLVMDEATASLDNASEARLMVAVRELLKGRTAIIIAHRLSTIESCDQVIVLEKGILKEQGSILELRKLQGLFDKYYQLYQEAPERSL
ncbi:MAG: ABC transporter ATP-binding protein, partial [Pseudomonadota bacterium]